MPFRSLKQSRLCFAKEGRGETGWDCRKWAHETNYKALPLYAPQRRKSPSRRSRSPRRKSKSPQRRGSYERGRSPQRRGY